MTGVRQPVHDLGAEAAVLSSAMLSRDALVEVRSVLPAPEAFYADAHRRVWQAVCAIDDAGDVADVVTVAGELQRAGRLESVGGAAYLAQLADATPAVAHVEAHARLVLDLWRQRRMVAECQRIAAEGQQSDIGVPVGEWLATFRSGKLSAAGPLLHHFEPWLKVLARMQWESRFGGKFDPARLH